jgi:hypothetical protein
VPELLLSPAPSNRQARLSFYLRLCTFHFVEKRTGRR